MQAADEKDWQLLDDEKRTDEMSGRTRRSKAAVRTILNQSRRADTSMRRRKEPDVDRHGSLLQVSMGGGEGARRRG